MLLNQFGIMAVVRSESWVVRRTANPFVGLVHFFPMNPPSAYGGISIPTIVKRQHLSRHDHTFFAAVVGSEQRTNREHHHCVPFHVVHPFPLCGFTSAAPPRR